MEQDFPPEWIEAVRLSIVWTHRCMVPLLMALAFGLFATFCLPVTRGIRACWWLCLSLQTAIGLWLLGRLNFTQNAADQVFRIYLVWASVLSFCGMMVSSFRWNRLTASRSSAAVLSAMQCVGLGVISLAASGLLAAVASSIFRGGSVRPITRDAVCRNNMQLIGRHAIGLAKKQRTTSLAPSRGDPLVSWRIDLLADTDQPELRRDYHDLLPWDDEKNLPVAQKVVSAYRCPASWTEVDGSRRVFTNYAMVCGPGTIAPGDRRLRESDIRDGLAHTAVFVEAIGLQIVWTEPRDADVSQVPIGINLKGQGKTDSPGLMSSYHRRGGAHMALADGSVRMISNTIDPQVLKSLTTVAGGESIPSD